MTGIGLAVLWIGYTSFAYGHALTKGANVTFSDMVLPSHRQYAIAEIRNAQLPKSSPGVASGFLNGILNFFTQTTPQAGYNLGQAAGKAVGG